MAYANIHRSGVKTYSLRSSGAGHRLADNFTLGEFQSGDGEDTIMVHPELVRGLQALRNEIGVPLHVTSGYRTQSWHRHIYDEINANRRAKGLAPTPIPWQSAHLFGTGADVYSDSVSVERIAHIARYRMGFGGVAMYKDEGFVHLDIEGVRTWADGVPPKNAAVGGMMLSGGLLAVAVGGILAWRYL